jgi:hypothetical protein
MTWTNVIQGFAIDVYDDANNIVDCEVFSSLEEFYKWAENYEHFDDEWMKEQKGWRLAGGSNDSNDPNLFNEWLFWRLQALTYLSPLMSKEITTIENYMKHGSTAKIVIGGDNSYNTRTNQINWNPNTKYLYSGVSDAWNKVPSLAVLAHELHHSWYDLTRGLPLVANSNFRRSAEKSAMSAENAVRKSLRNFFPSTYGDIIQRSAYVPAIYWRQMRQRGGSWTDFY